MFFRLLDSAVKALPGGNHLDLWLKKGSFIKNMFVTIHGRIGVDWLELRGAATDRLKVF